MRKLVLLFLCFGFFVVRAQPIAKTPDSVKKAIAIKLDTSKLNIRKIDEQAVKDYSVQKEFIYDDVAPESLSWWERFWRGFWAFLERLFGGKSTVPNSSPKILLLVLKYLCIAVAVGLVVFAVIKILGLNLKILGKKSKEIEIPYEESLENIHEINFDEQLEIALQYGNYRLAVRLLYLRTLKQLSDRELINWQPEKTNQAYVHELENLQQQEGFSRLTYQFEYIWYGDFYIDKTIFEPIYQSFSQFNQQAK